MNRVLGRGVWLVLEEVDKTRRWFYTIKDV